jgi:hypothetical protein
LIIITLEQTKFDKATKDLQGNIELQSFVENTGHSDGHPSLLPIVKNFSFVLRASPANLHDTSSCKVVP